MTKITFKKIYSSSKKMLSRVLFEQKETSYVFPFSEFISYCRQSDFFCEFIIKCYFKHNATLHKTPTQNQRKIFALHCISKYIARFLKYLVLDVIYNA